MLQVSSTINLFQKGVLENKEMYVEILPYLRDKVRRKREGRESFFCMTMHLHIGCWW
jgi:hypothetical protein